MTTSLSNKEIIVQHVERTSSNRSKFRRLSRDICREVFDIPEDNHVIFVYEKNIAKTILVGGITFQLSDQSISEPGKNFDNEYFNHITFMFIKIDYQLRGLGKQLLQEAMKDIRKHDISRPIRVESAGGAVGFFEKMGFVKKGDIIETSCGVSLFKYIQNMELLPT